MANGITGWVNAVEAGIDVESGAGGFAEVGSNAWFEVAAVAVSGSDEVLELEVGWFNAGTGEHALIHNSHRTTLNSLAVV